MQTFSEQISSAGRAQVQAQLDLFGNLASAAIDSAGRLALLQLNAVRDTLDQSGAMWFGMMSAGSPARLQLSAPAAAAEQEPVHEEHAPTTSAPPSTDEPGAARTAIAQAAAQVAPPSASMHPVAPPLSAEGKVELPRIRPIEADPPPPSLVSRPRRTPAPRK